MSDRTLAQQLAPLRQRLGPSPPSIHPIMHIEAELYHPHAAVTAANAARVEVLRWVSKRVGMLPEPAWQQKSFDHLIGGAAAAAVRLHLSGVDYWIIRCDDPDRDVAGRTWTTETSIVVHEGRARFALRQQVSIREGELRVGAAVPEIMRQLLAKPGLLVDGWELTELPSLVADKYDADDLIGFIEHPKRRCPVIVISPSGRADG